MHHVGVRNNKREPIARFKRVLSENVFILEKLDKVS